MVHSQIGTVAIVEKYMVLKLKIVEGVQKHGIFVLYQSPKHIKCDIYPPAYCVCVRCIVTAVVRVEPFILFQRFITVCPIVTCVFVVVCSAGAGCCICAIMVKCVAN